MELDMNMNNQCFRGLGGYVSHFLTTRSIAVHLKYLIGFFALSVALGALPAQASRVYQAQAYTGDGTGTFFWDVYLLTDGANGTEVVTGMYFDLHESNIPSIDPAILLLNGVDHTTIITPIPGSNDFYTRGKTNYGTYRPLHEPIPSLDIAALVFTYAGDSTRMTCSSMFCLFRDRISWPGETDGITESVSLLMLSDFQLIPPTSVPIIPATWLFASGLLGLVGVARRQVRS